MKHFLRDVLAGFLAPALRPVFHLFGLDPSLVGILIANDMGGYALAMELCESEAAGLYSGLFVASMLGCTLVFTIPVAFHILREEDKEVFSFGLLIGFITIPFGSLVGGLLAGFPMGMLLRNSVPVNKIKIIKVERRIFKYRQTIRR